MASTINGIDSGTGLLSTTREHVDMELLGFKNPYTIDGHNVLRGRVVIGDVSTDITIDNPRVDSLDTAVGGGGGLDSDQRIYIVGMEYAESGGGTLLIKSKVGAATAVQLAPYELTSNGGILLALGQGIMSPTDRGGALVLNASVATSILVHYVMAYGYVGRIG